MRQGLFNIGHFSHWLARSTKRGSRQSALASDLLISCLAELEERGWDLGGYLAERSDLPDSLREMLVAAARVHDAPRPVASAEFRARARAGFAARSSLAATSASPRRSALRWSFGPALGPVAVPIAIALVLVAVTGGVGTATAAALPGTALYPAKLAVENVRVLVAYTPQLKAQAHLKIAETRLQEADAESHRGDSVEVHSLIQRYEQQVIDAQAAAARVSSEGYHQQVAHAVATLHKRQEAILPATAVANGRPERDAANSKQGNAPTTVAARSTTAEETAPQHENRGKDHPAKNDVSSSPPPSPNPPLTDNAQAVALPTAATADKPDEQLVKTLVTQALAGDAADAATSSSAYVAYVKSLQTADGGAIERLHGQRAQLERALVAAQQQNLATVSSLQDALTAIDGALTNAHGSGQPSKDNPHQKSDSAKPTHGDSQRGNSRSDNHGNGDSATIQPTPTVTPTVSPVQNGRHGESDNHSDGSDGGQGH